MESTGNWFYSYSQAELDGIENVCLISRHARGNGETSWVKKFSFTVGDKSLRLSDD